MPELPEVETVRRTLAEGILGRHIQRVQIHRPDVIRYEAGSIPPPHALLAGHRINNITRHGKQLALLTEHQGPALCIHLGMTGSLQLDPPALHADAQPAAGEALGRDPHAHLQWHLHDGSTLIFRDPRRFGGVWCFDSFFSLFQNRWDSLGPDALTITPAALHRRLQTTRRSIKAALLDQSLIAGLGNIYIDELLFLCKLHPETPASLITRNIATTLARRCRSLLARAIAAGGSSIRDYVNAHGDAGGYQTRHRVYARGGQPCTRRPCRTALATALIAARTTVWCPRCQPTPASLI